MVPLMRFCLLKLQTYFGRIKVVRFIKPHVLDSGAVFLRMSQDASLLLYEEPVE